MRCTLRSLNVSLARDVNINGRRVRTAIGKRPVETRVAAGPLGLEGDEQADLTLHGGRGKAVYAYPHEHYRFWQTVRAQAQVSLWDDPLEPGSLGENLTLAGLLEEQVWIGDVLQFPDCQLAVSEPRHPCGKLNVALGFPQAGKMMVQSGWCGFYLSVRSPGTLQVGETAELVPGPREVGIRELFRAQMSRRSTF